MAVYEVNSPRIVWDRADGSIVAVDCQAGYYYEFTPGASDLLEAVGSGTTVDDIARAAGLDVSQVAGFVRQLLDDEVVREAPGGAGTPAADWEFGGGEISYEKLDDLKDLLEADPIHDVDPRQGWQLGSRGEHRR